MKQRKQYSLKIERQHQKLQELKVKLKKSLKIGTTAKEFFKPRNNNSYLPAVSPEKIKFKTDRFQSERLRYQKNLHTIMFEIQEKMSISDVGQLKSYTARLNNPVYTLPLKDKHNFKIQTLNLSPVKTKDNQICKSYLDKRAGKFSPPKIRRQKEDSLDLFGFQPWKTLEQNQITSYRY